MIASVVTILNTLTSPFLINISTLFENKSEQVLQKKAIQASGWQSLRLMI